MTDWEKFLERRKANIGFITRGRAFRELTEFEKHEAMMKEIESWQASIGKKSFHVGAEYSISKGYEHNLHPDLFKREQAIKTYIETPMDKDGILISEGIDVERYKWREIGIIKAFLYWIIGRKVRRIYDKKSKISSTT